MCTLECRVFLVLPDTYRKEVVADCLKQAIDAGDIASLVLPDKNPELSVLAKTAQDAGIAVLLDCAANSTDDHWGDGVHLPGGADYYRRTRAALGNDLIIGADCGSNRHLAMELAETGADYIGFSDIEWPQNTESIVKWWSQLFEMPCVVLDTVEGETAVRAVKDGADFVRPVDAMWESPEKAFSVISDLMKVLKV